YDEWEIRNRTCYRTWVQIPLGAPDPRLSSLPLDSQEDDLVPGEAHVTILRLNPERRARFGRSLEEAGPERGRVIRRDPAPPDPVVEFEWDRRCRRRFHGEAAGLQQRPKAARGMVGDMAGIAPHLPSVHQGRQRRIFRRA